MTTTAASDSSWRKKRKADFYNGPLFFSWKDGSIRTSRGGGKERTSTDDSGQGPSCEVGVDDLVAEARQALLGGSVDGQEEDEEDKFLSLSSLFRMHPLGVGLGDKLLKMREEEGVHFDPEQLMRKLAPSLDKYEQWIKDTREREKRREQLLAQVIALHEEGRRLHEDRLESRRRVRGSLLPCGK